MPVDSAGRIIARGDDVEIIADRSRGKVKGFPVSPGNAGQGAKSLVLVLTDGGIEVSVPQEGVRLLEPRCDR